MNPVQPVPGVEGLIYRKYVVDPTRHYYDIADTEYPCECGCGQPGRMVARVFDEDMVTLVAQIWQARKERTIERDGKQLAAEIEEHLG